MVVQNCPLCGGSGYISQAETKTVPQTVTSTDFKGRFKTQTIYKTETRMIRKPCARCGGSGKIWV